MSSDPQKDVNASLNLLDTVVKGHWLACACDVLGVNGLDDGIAMPNGLLQASTAQQQGFVEDIAKKVVDRLSIVDSSFFGCGTPDVPDKAYNMHE